MRSGKDSLLTETRINEYIVLRDIVKNHIGDEVWKDSLLTETRINEYIVLRDIVKNHIGDEVWKRFFANRDQNKRVYSAKRHC